MRRKWLGIAGGVVLVAALGVAAFLLLRDGGTEESSGNSGEESSTASISLVSQESNDVTSIDVTNSTGSFEVVRTAEATDDGNATYAIAGWEDLPTDTSTIWTLPNNASSLEADGVVEENCSDLTKFGLDKKTAIAVTLHFADGSDYAFRVGNAVSGGSDTYVAPADTDTVYTVRTSLVANFSKASTDFLSKTVLEEPAEDDYPIVNSVKVERKDIDYVLELDYDKNSAKSDSLSGSVATHVMVSPVPAYLSPDRSKDVTNGMFGLKADSIVYPHPTEEQLAETGITDPFATATMACDDGNTYVLKIGNRFTEKDDSGTETAYYNIYLDGVDVVYRIAESDCCWATVTPTDVASRLVLATYVWNIGDLTVKAEGEEDMHFEVKATSKKDAAVKLNGKEIDAERFRLFYTFLLKTVAEEVKLDGDTSGTPLAEIQLSTKDGKKLHDYTFYKIDDFTCLIAVDGQSAYTTRMSYLDTLRSNMEIFDTDQDFATNWS